jgi:ribosomal protein S17E
MRRISAVILCISLALAGCKAKELVDKASVSKDLQKRGTVDLLKEVGDDHYAPPEDGRLSEGQIQMYLKVREHEKTIAKVAREELKQHAEKADKKEKSIAGMMEGIKAMGSAADFLTADLRAAKDLGYNSQEYLWVKTQILAASTSVMAEKFNETISANFDKAYVEAKKAYDEAKDEQTKKIYADMLAGYDKSKQEMQQKESEDPALTWNRQLLSKHEDALNAYASELSKYEDKPGQVTQGIEEMQKKLEEAKKK